MKKRYVFLILAAVLFLALGAGVWFFRTGNVIVTIDDTDRHTEADIRACMELVKGIYAVSDSGNRLLRLHYDEALGQRREEAELKQSGGDEAIIILADFLAGKDAGTFTPGEIYVDFQWIFTRTGNGPWKLVNHGYA